MGSPWHVGRACVRCFQTKRKVRGILVLASTNTTGANGDPEGLDAGMSEVTQAIVKSVGARSVEKSRRFHARFSSFFSSFLSSFFLLFSSLFFSF